MNTVWITIKLKNPMDPSVKNVTTNTFQARPYKKEQGMPMSNLAAVDMGTFSKTIVNGR